MAQFIYFLSLIVSLSHRSNISIFCQIYIENKNEKFDIVPRN